MCNSASSIHVGAADGVSQHSSENDSVVGSFPSAASAPELHSVESSDAVKVDETSFMILEWLNFMFSLLPHTYICFQESGISSQPQPSPAVTERPGSNLSEPSLTTGAALEKYQIVAQKVAKIFLAYTF